MNRGQAVGQAGAWFQCRREGKEGPCSRVKKNGGRRRGRALWTRRQASGGGGTNRGLCRSLGLGEGYWEFSDGRKCRILGCSLLTASWEGGRIRVAQWAVPMLAPYCSALCWALDLWPERRQDRSRLRMNKTHQVERRKGVRAHARACVLLPVMY